jgi:hypothetical protein
VIPDRARCTGCDVTYVILGAGLLPRRAYAADLIGQAAAGSASAGSGCGGLIRWRSPPPASCGRRRC